MLDKNWIKNNPDAFDKAMIARGCAIRADDIIPLIIIDGKEKQASQLKNELKRIDSEIFLLKKREKNEEQILEKLELYTKRGIELVELNIEIFDLMAQLVLKLNQ